LVVHGVFDQRCAARLSALLVHDLLAERAPDALSDAAVDLSLDDERVDQSARVAHGDVVDDLDAPGLAFHGHDGDMESAGEGRSRREEIVRGFQPWAHPVRQRRAGRARRSELAEGEPTVRSTDDADDAVGEREVRPADLEPPGGTA